MLVVKGNGCAAIVMRDEKLEGILFCRRNSQQQHRFFCGQYRVDSAHSRLQVVATLPGMTKAQRQGFSSEIQITRITHDIP